MRTIEEIMSGAKPGDEVEICARECSDFHRISGWEDVHAFVQDVELEKPGKWRVRHGQIESYILKAKAGP